jgi:hypothetical protein
MQPENESQNRAAKPAEVNEDFSLIAGGPLFQIFRRAYLSGSGLELMRRRLLFFPTFSWLPLLLLSAWERHLWGQSVSLPFIYDLDAHARFLIALPLLIGAELLVHQRMRNVVKQFLDRGLIPASARGQFDQALASARRWRNSVTAEVLLLVFVYGIGVLLIWRKLVEVDLTTWHGTTPDGSLHPSIAGWWFGLVSLPFFQFLLFRWYYRLIIWGRLLWQVSRIKLDVLPTHPDRCAGLGFLSNVVYAFVPLLLAQGVLLSGAMANRVLYTGAPLSQFKVDILGLVLAAVVMILAPLLVFSPQLAAAKRKALREYGTLAQSYVREFDTKWLRGGAPRDESFIGSGDIQSLADLGNSYQAITDMRWVPFTPRTIIELGIIGLAPLAPLTLTIFPLDELLDRLLKVVF